MTIGTNWARYYEYRAGTLHEPSTIDELREVVAGAPRIRALGSRHSFNDIADSSELVSLAALEPDIEVDRDASTVTFSAGLRYGDLATVLEAEGFALHNLASLPHISVAGAVATGTHGSGDRNGNLATAVAAIELVTASGELATMRRGEPDFDGAVVSLGALGIVSRLTLDVQPSFEVRQDVYEGLSWSALLENFDAVTSSAYSVSVFTDWQGDDIYSVWLKSRLDAEVPPSELFGAPRAPEDLHPLREMPSENTNRQGGVPGAWNDRLPHFKMGFTPSNGDELQTEYLVPRHNAVAAIEAVRSLRDDITPLLHVSEFRSMAADELWMSGAYGTDAVGIHFTWKFDPEAVLALLPLLELTLAPFEVRPHWGKLFHSVDRGLYPKLGDFVALAERLDPAGKFRNEYLEESVF